MVEDVNQAGGSSSSNAHDVSYSKESTPLSEYDMGSELGATPKNAPWRSGGGAGGARFAKASGRGHKGGRMANRSSRNRRDYDTRSHRSDAMSDRGGALDDGFDTDSRYGDDDPLYNGGKEHYDDYGPGGGYGYGDGAGCSFRNVLKGLLLLIALGALATITLYNYLLIQTLRQNGPSKDIRMFKLGSSGGVSSATSTSGGSLRGSAGAPAASSGSLSDKQALEAAM